MGEEEGQALVLKRADVQFVRNVHEALDVVPRDCAKKATLIHEHCVGGFIEQYVLGVDELEEIVERACLGKCYLAAADTGHLGKTHLLFL